MVLSKHQKLQELGIDIWKKRSEQEAIIFQDEVYLTDRNCILCLGKKDEEVSEEDKTVSYTHLTLPTTDLV